LVLSNLEDHIQRLQQRLAGFQETVAQLHQSRELSEQELERARAEVERLNRLIDENRRQLEVAREKAAARRASYAIIPYQGPNETQRRPIYIECLEDSVVIQPEGVTLNLRDLSGPPDPGNPLAAALRAAREYIAGAGVAAGGQSPDPYPLLIVRPQGIKSYVFARRAIESWGADFGYELVNAEMELAYPSSDPQLARIENQAVEIARARRQELARSAPSPFRIYADGGDGGGGGGGGGDGFFDSGSPLMGGGPSDHSGDDRYGEIPSGGAAFEGPVGGEPSENPPGTGGDASSAVGAPSASGGELAGQGGAANEGPRESTAQEGGPDGPARPEGEGPLSSAANAPGEANGVGGDNPFGRPNDGSSAAAGSRGSIGGAQPSASQRGADWGLSKGAGPSVPLNRPIRIECHADRLILLPEDANGTSTEISFAQDTAGSIDRLVQAIHHRADSWGIAGSGLHWKPTLVLYVSPAGTQRAADLSKLLEGSGLNIEVHRP
jgi:hypothetical protein